MSAHHTGQKRAALRQVYGIKTIAVGQMNCRTQPAVWVNELLLPEQDHLSVKSSIGPILGFKDLDQAAVTIATVALLTGFTSANLDSGICAFKSKARRQ